MSDHPRRDQTPDPRRNTRGHQRGAARTRGDSTRTAHRPAARAKASDPARTLAYEILREVDHSDAYANLLLPPRLAHRQIDTRDAAFATELTYGTLRLRGRYDAVLTYCVDRPLTEVDPPVLDLLRLGAHQLLGMRVPTHAAVSETVALARDQIGVGRSQFVNAVLRRVCENDLDGWLARIDADTPDPLESLARTASHPLWITRALREALVGSGRDVAELPDLLTADNTAPRVTLVARPGLTGPNDLPATTPAPYAPTAHLLDRGDPAALAAVREGRAGVQDEGSQLVALALAAAPLDGPDARWLDLCAGPGGKAALLAALAAERGARIVANEIAPHRAALVRKALTAAPAGSVEAVRAVDGRETGTYEPGGYDRVLVDAPCTGLGALRRRPESRWRRTPADLMALTGLQRELLASALDAVRPGGVVAYVTCSPHLAETQFVVADVTRKRPDIEILDAPAVMRSVIRPGTQIDLGDRMDVQLWPHIHGTDAMHLTLLRRR